MLESTISKVVFVLVLIAALNLNADEPTRPNVIFVLADDLGIGDLQPTNPDCKIKTPYLQQMADEGITFLDAHSPSAVCTPTRYGVLTGRYNWRSRLAKGVLGGTSDHLIPADRPTVARMLQNAGYHTQMIGKWHLGWDWATLKNEEAARKKNELTSRILTLVGPSKTDRISMDSMVTMAIADHLTCRLMFG